MQQFREVWKKKKKEANVIDLERVNKKEFVRLLLASSGSGSISWMER